MGQIMNQHRDEARTGAASILRRFAGRPFKVAPSPLNGVKLELAVILTVGGLWLLVIGRITGHAGWQLLLALGYGVAGMTWLLWRTQRVLRAFKPSAGPERHEPQ